MLLSLAGGNIRLLQARGEPACPGGQPESVPQAPRGGLREGPTGCPGFSRDPPAVCILARAGDAKFHSEKLSLRWRMTTPCVSHSFQFQTACTGCFCAQASPTSREMRVLPLGLSTQQWCFRSPSPCSLIFKGRGCVDRDRGSHSCGR